MTFDAAFLAGKLEQIAATTPFPKRLVIAFSGGLDSSVLLHAITTVVSGTGKFASLPVVALHIDHDLNDASADWAEHCRAVAGGLDVPFESIRVSVDLYSGDGPEAAARTARYQGLAERMDEGDWLLSAHHLDDQGETLLMNLLRGSGPAGIAAIGVVRPFERGWLARPLLDVSRNELHDYATQNELSWLDDPSNSDLRFDRNYLRHDVLPRLDDRWHDVNRRLMRSARLAREANELLTELARTDADSVLERRDRLSIAALSVLSPPRQRNLVRYAIAELGLPMPSAAQLDRIWSDVIAARPDAQPVLSWPGTLVRRYRNALYILPDSLPQPVRGAKISMERVDLGRGLGALEFEPADGPGLAPRCFRAGLRIEPRLGGEMIKLEKQGPTKKLKKLLQELGVVPWMRDRIPLLYCEDDLVAVGDLWTSAAARADDGIRIRWVDRPALH